MVGSHRGPAGAGWGHSGHTDDRVMQFNAEQALILVALLLPLFGVILGVQWLRRERRREQRKREQR